MSGILEIMRVGKDKMVKADGGRRRALSKKSFQQELEAKHVPC